MVKSFGTAWREEYDLNISQVPSKDAVIFPAGANDLNKLVARKEWIVSISPQFSTWFE
jgi:hypothetical protein